MLPQAKNTQTLNRFVSQLYLPIRAIYSQTPCFVTFRAEGAEILGEYGYFPLVLLHFGTGGGF